MKKTLGSRSSVSVPPILVWVVVEKTIFMASREPKDSRMNSYRAVGSRLDHSSQTVLVDGWRDGFGPLLDGGGSGVRRDGSSP
jgi:hypothetical protein